MTNRAVRAAILLAIRRHPLTRNYSVATLCKHLGISRSEYYVTRTYMLKLMREIGDQDNQES